MGKQRDPITCAEFVELVTEYFEGALPAGDRRRFERHLAACPPCGVHLLQLRATIASIGSLREDDIPAGAKTELLNAFRDWKSERD